MGREEGVKTIYYSRYLEYLAMSRYCTTPKFIQAINSTNDPIPDFQTLDEMRVWSEKLTMEDYESKSVKHLRHIAASYFIPQYWLLDKHDLISRIQNAKRGGKTEASASS